jgi:hypothetical protein
VNIANKHSTKLGTLIYSAQARTVRPTGADYPDRGPSGSRAGLSAWLFLVPNKSFTVEVEYYVGALNPTKYTHF